MRSISISSPSHRITASLHRAALWLSTLVFSASVAACEEHALGSGASKRSEPTSKHGGKVHAQRPADRTVRGSIVVLGSSTSAGTGPKDPKNAWVSRYRARLAEQFPNVQLVNLAVGGYSTFEIQPSGFHPPPNRPAPVEGKNISAALALKPSAIVVNLPSNDQANGYPLNEQLANYDRVATLAKNAHVPLWISTPQPRNFNDSAQIEALIRTRDAIGERFAPRTLDFWTPFASANGFIKGRYNAGDGTHLNDDAHAILASIVEAARIPEQFPRAPAL
ncbi:MAG TPA: SGNH/GDSL hydrolase family protein [Polyangiaceae bacterium]|nr:SGNH/GDSL hydrolase family protein [Polyangiaceae bacterium]